MAKIRTKIRGGGIKNVIIKILMLSGLNNSFILFTSKRAVSNEVNLNYCHDFKNVGDNISPVILSYVADRFNIELHKDVGVTKHLYGVGSIITAGAQDCTVWGSGLLNTSILNRLNNRKIDFRAVRGPLTRIVLIDRGFSVPEVYGDPAILMPLIYNPIVEKKYKVSVITHTDDLLVKNIHQISIATEDWKHFVREIKESELIISSSLHGIIFAETYGVPAVMLRPKSDLFKYFDYYYSTERYRFPIADSVDAALNIKPVALPDLERLQSGLLKSFPTDLWS